MKKNLNKAKRGSSRSDISHTLRILSSSFALCVPSHFSHVWLCDTMDCTGSSVSGILQERIWSGLPFPPPGDLPNTGVEPAFLASPALAGRFFITEPTGKSMLGLILISQGY